MTITFEQFKRAFDALKASDARRQRVNAALNDDTQDFTCDIGSDPAVWEFQRLLEAWTRDREDENGPWSDDVCAEGDISIGRAAPGFMTLIDEKGTVLPHLTTAEEIWSHWRTTSTGPFRPSAAYVTPAHGGALLRIARTRRKLSQQRLGEFVGVSSKGHISNIETGVDVPSVRVAVALERETGVDAARLNPEVAIARASLSS